MAPFAFQTRDFEGAQILTLEGDLETRGASELHKHLLAAMAKGQRSFLIDLERVDSLAAAGLRVFLGVGERLQAEGGALALCCPSAPVVKILETAGMDRTLQFHAHRDQALEWLRESVRQGRIARAAARLLRRRDEAARPGLGGPYRPSNERSILAVSLLKIERATDGGDAGHAGEDRSRSPHERRRRRSSAPR